jgi:hypothetical protein
VGITRGRERFASGPFCFLGIGGSGSRDPGALWVSHKDTTPTSRDTEGTKPQRHTGSAPGDPADFGHVFANVATSLDDAPRLGHVVPATFLRTWLQLRACNRSPRVLTNAATKARVFRTRMLRRPPAPTAAVSAALRLLRTWLRLRACAPAPRVLTNAATYAGVFRTHACERGYEFGGSALGAASRDVFANVATCCGCLLNFG